MSNYFRSLWQRLTGPEADDRSEVDRIARLQQAATARRKEHAALKSQAETADDDALQAALSASRRRMEEAETAHTTALQKWENRESRQRSY
jgi:hypothetical protein